MLFKYKAAIFSHEKRIPDFRSAKLLRALHTGRLYDKKPQCAVTLENDDNNSNFVSCRLEIGQKVQARNNL